MADGADGLRYPRALHKAHEVAHSDSADGEAESIGDCGAHPGAIPEALPRWNVRRMARDHRQAPAQAVPAPAPAVATAPQAAAAPAAGAAAPPAPLLQLQDLSVRFAVRGGLLQRPVGWFDVVHQVSFDVGVGETLALGGESGCGKTTTGKAIVLLRRPTKRLGAAGEAGSSKPGLESVGAAGLIQAPHKISCHRSVAACQRPRDRPPPQPTPSKTVRRALLESSAGGVSR